MFKEEDFKEIGKILNQYVDKDKQIESLINTLTEKLKNSTSQRLREQRNTAYFLSLLNYN
jgi:hypothetical protein